MSEHEALLVHSYCKLTGRNLIEVSGAEAAIGPEVVSVLFEAPFVLVSHNTVADPIFNYGNRMALNLFQMSWEEFTKLPSRKSAEPVCREEREQLLSRVREHGFIDNCKGVRISSTGIRFFIRDATIWNIINPRGVYCGQAAMFRHWEAVP